MASQLPRTPQLTFTENSVAVCIAFIPTSSGTPVPSALQGSSQPPRDIPSFLASRISRGTMLSHCVLLGRQLGTGSVSCLGVKYLRLGGSKRKSRPPWECQARPLNTSLPSAPSPQPRVGSESPLAVSTLALLFKRKVQVLHPKDKNLLAQLSILLVSGCQ